MGIEAARGIAAVLVILYHTSRHIDLAFHAPILRAVFQFGHNGVDLFFVISGFIIYYVHFQDVGRPERLVHYASRRFSRIMPTYWVALVATLLMISLGTHPEPGIAALVSQSVFLPSGVPMILGVAWTLNYEATFYVLFATLIANRLAGWILFAGWFGFVILSAVIGWHVPGLPDRFQNAVVLEFGAGMAVAAIAKRNLSLPAPAVLAAGLAVFAAGAWFEDRGQLDGYADMARLIYGGASVLVVLGLVSLPNQGWFARHRLLGVLGSASYSLYIFQFVFIGTAWQAMLHTGVAALIPPLPQFAMLATAAITGGVLASRHVEQPLIRACRSIRVIAPA